ncbi:MAG: hypothetical protein A3E80_03355 [Chlamydiae bacterium RIFCSPHIGHO2_12_FULL_49_9]|nr:MAG: hypothetical protein A3E80_03355 [Chlamydiae bacterium RIFCSPHIGHO2_12_FULL_49_9]
MRGPKIDDPLGFKEAIKWQREERNLKKKTSGDTDALIEYMYRARMINKEALDDYYEIKKKYGD